MNLDCTAAFSAAITVLFISMATVMGPTPPGTGVITEATWGGGKGGGVDEWWMDDGRNRDG